MKILLFGATGMIGQRLLAEALRRGHAVTAAVRNPSKLTQKNPKLRVEKADVTNLADVRRLVAGEDVVVSAFAPPQGQEHQVVDVARTLVDAVKSAQPSARLIAVGGAGGLKIAPNLRVIDTPDFPAAWKPIAQAHIDAYQQVYSKADIDWTFFAPAALIQPGERTGKYRTGRDHLIADERGKSSITAEDYAVVFLDEIEKPRFRRSVMTAGY